MGPMGADDGRNCRKEPSMATNIGVLTDAGTEDDLGLDLNDPRIKALAEANGMLAKPKKEDPEQGEAEEQDRVELDGDQNTAEPQADEAQEESETPEEVQDDSSKGNDWKSTAEKNKWPKGFRSQLERMTRQRDRERKEFAEKLKAVEELKKQVESLTKGTQQPPKKISRENFINDDEYIEAKMREELLAARQKEAEEYARIKQEQQQQQQLASSWESKVNGFYSDEKSKGSYAEALAELRAGYGDNFEYLDQRIQGYTFQSPVGPKILEYLGRNLDQVDQLASLHDFDLSAALHKISSHVSRPPRAARKVTQAPAPTGDLRASSGVKTAAEMSDAEKLAYYRKHGQMPD